MSDHVKLGDRWSLWSTACLRGAGFPAHRVLELATPELAAAADRWLDAEEATERMREAAVAACRLALEGGPPELRASIKNAQKQLWQHRVPKTVEHGAVEAARIAFASAIARRDELASSLAIAHADARRQTSEAVRHVARDDAFHRALLWQNRGVLRSAVEPLLRHAADASDSKARTHERLVASYLQRYCVKNDTIGFFGPLGWARLADSAEPIVQRPGPALLARSMVFYEYWAIDAVAARLSSDPELRPYFAPRRLPHYRIDGTTLHHPIERRTELPPEYAAVAARCDGVRTARELARDVCAVAELELVDESHVFEILDELVASKLIVWSLEIPTGTARAERWLAEALARVEPPELRARAAATFDELEARRATVATAGDAAALDAALAALEATFAETTGVAAHRAGGQTYAGRTPLYLDCVRDLDLQLGRPVLDRIAAPLELVLDSARWFTHEIAARYRPALGAIHDKHARAGAPLDFARFWSEVPALFPGAAAAGSIAGAVRDELRRRWGAILAIDPSERVAERSSARLRADVARAFAAPGPGWPAARHHSPDLMIAARSADALARGDCVVVLGELHTGNNTVMLPAFLEQHRDPGALIALHEADLDCSCIAPVWSKSISCADYYSRSARDVDLENGDTRSARPREQVVAVAELVVERRDGRLEVRTIDGARRWDVIAFLQHHLIAESFAAFSLLPPAAATPRVTIDGVVIARATWRLTTADVAWSHLEEPGARFAAARGWARTLGMPRWVFAKTDVEVKPVYVDFDSLIYTEIFAKLLRRATTVAVSEMLPTVDETWVVDAASARYTCELRMAAVDSEQWMPR